MHFFEYFNLDLKFIIPESYLALSALFLLTLGVLIKKTEKNIIYVINWLAIEIFIITGLLFLNNPFYNNLIFNGMLIMDDFRSFIKIVLIFSATLVLYISFEYFKDEKINAFEYSVLIMWSTLGMIFLVSSYDFIALYLALELQSLAFYILAAFKRNSQFSTEAGLKYFILGALSSGILLFGCSLIYGLTGSTNFETINHLLINRDFQFDGFWIGVSLAMIFIIIALLFKLAAAPFHMWAPDVYEGSPLIVTAFFAIVPKIAVLGVLIELFMEIFYGLVEEWQIIFIFSSILSMLIGAIGAIDQKKIKRLLAYSAIGHIGYMLIGLASVSTEGIQALLIYIIVYIIMSINIFTVALSLYKNKDLKRIIYINELTGLSKENSVLAITLAITVLSMAGIPPLAGFISKFYIFTAAVESSLYFLAIIGVLTSVIATVYYIRLIKIMYFENVNIYYDYKIIDFQKSLVLSLSFLFILFFMINPSFLFIITHQLALSFSI